MRNLLRRPRIYFLLLAVIFFSGGWWLISALYRAHESSPSASAQQKFNVVIISIDSLRADHMSLYGYQRETTPNIDKWAQGAFVFSNYYATSFLTPISEMSVQTGDYPFTSGMINFESKLRPTINTLAQVLQRNGWQTIALGSSPEFSTYASLKDASSRGFDTYDYNSTQTMYRLPWAGRGDIPTSTAITFMQKEEATGKPFFLWLTVGSAHWPYGEDWPPYYTDPSYNGFLRISAASSTSIDTAFTIFDTLYGHIFDGARYGNNHEIISNNVTSDIQYLEDRYDDGIRVTDEKLAPLLAYLDNPAVASNTIVVIESEHGEDFGEHGYIGHYDILDTQTHVPLILKVPDTPGRTISAMASGVDIFPTLLDILGIAHESVDGISFWKYLTQKTAQLPQDAVYLTRTPLWERVISPVEPWLTSFVKEDNLAHFHDTAIQTSQWELIHRTASAALEQYSWFVHLTGKPISIPEYELYYLPTDPYELHNVYTSNNPVAIKLKNELTQWENAEMSPSTTPSSSAIQPYF